MESQVFLVNQVRKDNQVFNDRNILGQPDHAKFVHLVREDRLVQQDHQDQRVVRDFQAKMGQPERMVYLALPVPLGRLDSQVRMEILVLKVNQVNQVFKEQKGNQDLKAHPVDQEHKDPLEMLAPMEKMEALALQAQQEESADQANLLRSVDLVILVNRAFLEKMLNIVLAHGGPNWLRKPRLKN